MISDIYFVTCNVEFKLGPLLFDRWKKKFTLCD